MQKKPSTEQTTKDEATVAKAKTGSKKAAITKRATAKVSKTPATTTKRAGQKVAAKASQSASKKQASAATKVAASGQSSRKTTATSKPSDTSTDTSTYVGLRLNNLSEYPFASASKNRRGRGIGSGQGKTSGRGHKGQKARSGGARRDFEGGQMPLFRRVPKRGFTSRRQKLAAIPIGRLEAAIASGRIDSNNEIDEAILRSAGLVASKFRGIKLIRGGELSYKVNLKVSAASSGAAEQLRALGGNLIIRQPERKVTHNLKVKNATAAATPSSS